MNDPLWYKDAIFYELRVGAFFDSDGDGIGDFAGLTQKLPYLQDLGVTTLWLLPFYPSPLKDDGYDIADYLNIRSDCGTLRDFRSFLKEAHHRGLRVVTELVLNHTSDQHPWFQRARRAKKGSSLRDFYVWSDSDEKFKEVRIIFKDFESSNWTWDPVAKQYYWHRFYSHQPDLNFDNPVLKKEMFRTIDFWFDMGVDGLRLDAIPYLFEREGTNGENLPETHALLKDLRKFVDRKFEDRMLLAEANQWSEDAAEYFGSGDECQMAFHFPIMPRLFMSIHMEDRFPIVDILQQTPPIPDSCQWAVFLRNHDELTLEMVTDEERDYMYRVYANDPQARINLGIRRRLAPLLGNDRRKIELMNGLLFSLPGTPVIYYGDEIGMGDNFHLGDRNGVRTPMQWSSDRNAGFSRANPQRLYLPVNIDPEYHYETVNVEAQQDNLHSLLWWMKRLIALRKRYRAFGRGSLEFLNPKNRKVLAFIRKYENETLLIVANLSRFVQYVELDLSAYKQMVPVELFGQTDFPPIGDLPYLLTLGPRGIYWFALRGPSTSVVVPAVEPQKPILAISEGEESVFRGAPKALLEESLPDYLRIRRWFRGKGRRIKSAKIQEVVPVSDKPFSALVFVQVDYREGGPETYFLPLAFASGEEAGPIRQGASHAILALIRLKGKEGEREGILYDAMEAGELPRVLLKTIARRRRHKGTTGTLTASTTPFLKKFQGKLLGPIEWRRLDSEQSNSSVIFSSEGEKLLLLKVFRVVEEGTNPDLEIGRCLTEQTEFVHNPQVAGFLEHAFRGRHTATVGILHEYVENEGDAWSYTLDQVDQFFERVASLPSRPDAIPAENRSLLDLAGEDSPSAVRDLVGAYLETARLIGVRTGEFHKALASVTEDPHFAPEPFSSLYQRSIYQSMRNLVSHSFRLLRDHLPNLSEGLRGEAQGLLEQEGRILKCFLPLTQRKITALRIRCHGDYHLGQILFTGKDFFIFDFEGEPSRSLSERRIKRSPLRDVAGMIRSFEYAARTALVRIGARGVVPAERHAELRSWAEVWSRSVAAEYLKSYLGTVKGSAFLPQSREELNFLINIYLLEKSIYELGYELNNRPDWLKIPLRAIPKILETMG